MSKKQELIDASNDLHNAWDELEPTWKMLQGVCDEAAMKVKSARDSLEYAMDAIDRALGIDDA